MCGLAGYIRHPKGADADLAQIIGIDLLLAMESRGAHATGIAVFGNESFICKSAVPARVAVESGPWKRALEKVNDSTTIVIGHTRHSTHPSNTKLDEAAHPFHIGKVVGAHNGIIQNWRDVFNEVGNKNAAPWIVDSQAAIGALDAIDDPVKALDLLDGYWALSWVKGDHLYLSKTQSAQLAFAYVSGMRTMFWASTAGALEGVLKRANVGPFQTYELGANAVYRFDATKFDDHGAHGESKYAPFEGLRTKPTQRQLTATSGGTTSGNGFGRRSRGGSAPSSRVPLEMTADEMIGMLKKHDDTIALLMRRLTEIEEELADLRGDDLVDVEIEGQKDLWAKPEDLSTSA